MESEGRTPERRGLFALRGSRLRSFEPRGRCWVGARAYGYQHRIRHPRPRGDQEEIGRIGRRRLLRSLARVLAAGAVMYAVAWAGTMLLGVGSGFLDRAIILTVVGSASLAAYLGAAFLLGAEELKSVVALFRRRAGIAGDETSGAG